MAFVQYLEIFVQYNFVFAQFLEIFIQFLEKLDKYQIVLVKNEETPQPPHAAGCSVNLFHTII